MDSKKTRGELEGGLYFDKGHGVAKTPSMWLPWRSGQESSPWRARRRALQGEDSPSRSFFGDFLLGPPIRKAILSLYVKKQIPISYQLLFIGLLSLFISQSAFSKELEEEKTYRLEKSVHNLMRTRDGKTDFIAVKNSKFIVVDNQANPDAYIVRFIKIYDHGDILSTVTEDEEYKLDKLIGGTAIINYPAKQQSDITLATELK